MARAAVGCRVCFETLRIAPPIVDIAQPRWVGPNYWVQSPRILLMLLNPGSGEGYNEVADQSFRDLLVAFREGSGTLDSVLRHQGDDMPRWGRGRFSSFYLDGLGLELDEVAFANVAWCATRGNQYPKSMLDNCYSRFTDRLLEILRPDLVVLSGTNTHPFRDLVQQRLPESKVITTLHYAHRKGRAAEEDETCRVKEEMAV